MDKTKHYVQIALFVFFCNALLALAVLFVPPSYHHDGGGLVLLGSLFLVVEEMLFHRNDWIPIRSR